MISRILVALAIALVILVIIIALRPADFRYSRSLTIAAPPAALFEQVSDLHKFQTWNPWAKIDPQSKITFTGPASGLGAAYSWAGNNDVGEGTMTNIECRPSELLRFKMEFKKPMAGISTSEFTFKPVGDQTLVTWSMFGANGFAGKAFGLFVDCEKMIGDPFEKGLNNLAEAVRKPN